MNTADCRLCAVCGAKLDGAMKFCPVCIFRRALPVDGESVADSFEPDGHGIEAISVPDRFEHYEVVKDSNGQPVELGRGAMGVTYKAIDVELHCPAALKVINERFLADESMRLRFVREARSAASLRHPNVASGIVCLARVDSDASAGYEVGEHSARPRCLLKCQNA